MTPTEHNPMTTELLLPTFEQLLADDQTEQLRQALAELRDPEVADVVAGLGDEGRASVFALLDEARRAEVFALLELDDQQQLVETLPDEAAAAIFNELEPDDRVDFLEDSPDDLAEAALALLAPDQRAETETLLEYPEDSVGREMTPAFLTLAPTMTAAEALEKIRREGRDAETLHTVYVVDAQSKLLDHVRLREIVLAASAERIAALVEGQTVALSTHDDRERAVEVMERYDLPVLPVVDEANRLVGIVTFDDVADVAEEEATEDMHKMGGLEALDAPYLSTGLFALIRKRIFWLLILFAGGMLTIVAMRGFEAQLEKVVVLALFVPLIIASGGNSGAQAASLMIRALAIGEVGLREWRTVVGRELISGLVMGSTLGVLGLVVVYGGHRFGLLEGATLEGGEVIGRVALVVGTALVGVVIVGTLVGSMLPFALKALGADPAAGSTPLVATIVDVSGLVIYFAVATMLLGL